MKKVISFLAMFVVLAIVWTSCVKDPDQSQVNNVTVEESVGTQNEVADRSCGKAINIRYALGFDLCGNLPPYGDDCYNGCTATTSGRYGIDTDALITKTMLTYWFAITNNNPTTEIIFLGVAGGCKGSSYTFLPYETKGFAIATSPTGCCYIGECL